MSGEPSAQATSARAVIIAAIVAAGVGALLIWGFLEGRGEATAEAQSEQPIKPAVEVSQSNAEIGRAHV